MDMFVPPGVAVNGKKKKKSLIISLHIASASCFFLACVAGWADRCKPDMNILKWWQLTLESGHNMGGEVPGSGLIKNTLLISFPANSGFNVPFRMRAVYIRKIALALTEATMPMWTK